MERWLYVMKVMVISIEHKMVIKEDAGGALASAAHTVMR